MVEGGEERAFQVVLFDGEREINIGDVIINPTLEYKLFQQMISQRIGISPNQISIYLVDWNNNPKSPFSEGRRRIPITGKVNFGLICRQKGCCFLVVLKKSRRSRNRRERAVHGLEFARPAMHSVPENLILLRRNQPSPFHDQITQSELADLNERLQNLRVRRENYQMAMAEGNLNSPSLIPNMRTDLVPNIDEWWYIDPLATTMMTKNDNTIAFCEECVNTEKNGKATPFHHCVNDAVVDRLATRLGPIRRPNKPFP